MNSDIFSPNINTKKLRSGYLQAKALSPRRVTDLIQQKIENYNPYKEL